MHFRTLPDSLLPTEWNGHKEPSYGTEYHSLETLYYKSSYQVANIHLHRDTLTFARAQLSGLASICLSPEKRTRSQH